MILIMSYTCIYKHICGIQQQQLVRRWSYEIYTTLKVGLKKLKFCANTLKEKRRYYAVAVNIGMEW